MIQEECFESDRVLYYAEYDSNTTRYVYSPRGIHAMEDDLGEWSYPLVDGLNSNRVEVDASLSIDASGSYQPYGTLFDENGTFNLPHRFTGEWRDEITELQNHRARYYAPNIGTWLSQDFLETPNRYAYVNGDPINNLDPTGLISCVNCERRLDMQAGSTDAQRYSDYLQCLQTCEETYYEYTSIREDFLDLGWKAHSLFTDAFVESSFSQTVRENPLHALGIATGAGALAIAVVLTGGTAIAIPIIAGATTGFWMGRGAGAALGELMYQVAVSGKCGCTIQQQALELGESYFIRKSSEQAALYGTFYGGLFGSGPIGQASGAIIEILDSANTINFAIQDMRENNPNVCNGITAVLGVAGIVGGVYVENQGFSQIARSLELDVSGPRPPGWTPDWWAGFGIREKQRQIHWFDTKGGEWRYHGVDRHHSSPHWDYNPWNHATDAWLNVDFNGNVIPKK